MAPVEIIQLDGGSYDHRRHFSPSPSHAMGPVPVEFARAENLGNLDRNRNTHEVEHENEPESDPVSSGRRRVAGVSRDGEDGATPPRCAVNRVYPERRARVRRPP
jgi:hypothetical protein